MHLYVLLICKTYTKIYFYLNFCFLFIFHHLIISFLFFVNKCFPFSRFHKPHRYLPILLNMFLMNPEQNTWLSDGLTHQCDCSGQKSYETLDSQKNLLRNKIRTSLFNFLKIKSIDDFRRHQWHAVKFCSLTRFLTCQFEIMPSSGRSLSPYITLNQYHAENFAKRSAISHRRWIIL